MSSQPQPTTRGTYRVKIYQNNRDGYWKYVPLNQRNPGWIQLDAVPTSSHTASLLEVSQSIESPFAVLIHPFKVVDHPCSGSDGCFYHRTCLQGFEYECKYQHDKGYCISKSRKDL